jgi:two-component system response regulator YesN
MRRVKDEDCRCRRRGEHQANTRQGLVKLLGKLPGAYEVVGEAANGQIGYALIRDLRPDLVITDIKMPVLSGIDMLTQLNEQGYRHKAIVLTGYSEYEYAKKALKLGVADFLEKPITADDLKAVLAKIEQTLVYEQLGGLPNRPRNEQTEQLIRHTLYRDDIDPSLLSFHLQQAEGFDARRTTQLVQIYDNTVNQDIVRLFRSNHSGLIPHTPTVVFTITQDKKIYLILQTDMEITLMDEWLWNQISEIMGELSLSAVVSRVTIKRSAELKEGFARLNQLRRWSISNVKADILSEELIASLEVQSFQSSESFDNRMVLAIAESSHEELEKVFDDWLRLAWDAKKCCPPQQIIDATIRLVTNLLTHLSARYGNAAVIAQQNDWLNQLWAAQTKIELGRVLAAIVKQISGIQKKSAYSLVVIKALKMIDERYNDGINLDEISSALHITPEYLSSIFTKEVGQTYTAFMKELRINKAKQLLTCSELKTFEIAKAVGYPDAKYFSRVFKDVTGLSPGDYQRLHRTME